MSQATKSINHSVVHLGRLIVPKVKQKKLVWSDEANKLVWQFIEPKILFESEIITGKDTNKIKVCPVNKDAYNSELEKKHRDELQYGNNNDDELSMEERFKQGLPVNETPVSYLSLIHISEPTRRS